MKSIYDIEERLSTALPGEASQTSVEGVEFAGEGDGHQQLMMESLDLTDLFGAAETVLETMGLSSGSSLSSLLDEIKLQDSLREHSRIHPAPRQERTAASVSSADLVDAYDSDFLDSYSLHNDSLELIRRKIPSVNLKHRATSSSASSNDLNEACSKRDKAGECDNHDTDCDSDAEDDSVPAPHSGNIAILKKLVSSGSIFRRSLSDSTLGGLHNDSLTIMKAGTTSDVGTNKTV